MFWVNQRQVLVTQLAAKKEGYSDVLYLDAKSDNYLEEVSSCNIFVVKVRPLAMHVRFVNVCMLNLRAHFTQISRARPFQLQASKAQFCLALPAAVSLSWPRLKGAHSCSVSAFNRYGLHTTDSHDV